MIRPFLAWVEKLLVLLLAASFVLPLLVAGGLKVTHNKTNATLWLRNQGLSGVTDAPEQVTASRATILNGTYQQTLATNYATNFAGREFFIRSVDEIYLRAFRLSPTGVLVGPRLSLIEPSYCLEYCLHRPPPGALEPLVADLRRLQDFCTARGLAFAVLLTPSKASIYPENLPAGWLRRYDPRPRFCDNFLALLQQHGIRHVDGHRLTAELKKTSADLVFPLGGVHWADPAALASTNALLECLASQGLPVQPIHAWTTRVTKHPTGQDNDLARLLNVVLPLPYRAPVVTVTPASPPRPEPSNLVIVGGSFCWKLMDQLYASEQFSELQYYNYYSRVHHCKVNGDWHIISEPTKPVNFDTDVFAADSLVLEVNEESIPDPVHLVKFLHDALAVLPDPHAPRAAFHYRGRLIYQWGDTLSFKQSKDEDSLSTNATAGFTNPDPTGIFTEAPVAKVTLTVVPATQDMVLAVDAGAFVMGQQLPEQQVIVSVNGHALGQWVWTDSAQVTRELPVPKEYLTGHQVQIKFRFGRLASPRELGSSMDSRLLGLHVASLRLYAPDRQTEGSANAPSPLAK